MALGVTEGVTLTGVTEGVTLFGVTEGVLDTIGVVEGAGATELGAGATELGAGAEEAGGHIDSVSHERSVNVHEE